MQKAGGPTIDEGYDVAVDGSGNAYATGYFSGTATFGGTSLTSSGSSDIYVVKVDNQGVVEWAVKAGGSGTDRGLSIDIDGSGNCYVTGFYNGTATFGGSNVTSAGAQDVFIAKYNSGGTLQWVESAGGSGSDIGNGISVDNSGNAVVTGEFSGTATFGGTSITSTNGTTDVFTTKYSTGGTFTWVEQGAGTGSNRGIDVATDGSGNVYITGQFSDSITFDQTQNNTMLNVIFVVKYNSSGVEQWFRLMGGATANITKAIECDNSGNAYVTGDLTGDLTIFAGGNPVIGGTYSDRIFLVKFSSAGAVSWSTSTSSDSDVTVNCIGVDASSVYIGGNFECRFDEYSDEYGEAIFNSVGNTDIFVAKYNGSGNFQYARHVASRSNDFCFGISPDNAGRIHFTGSFQGDLNIPTSANFVDLNNWPDVGCPGNNGYCNDSDYGSFHQLQSAGNLDVVIANAIDPNREPYDYYERSGGGCVRDIIDPCIDPNCPDTAGPACAAVNVMVDLMACDAVAPNFNINWQGGSNQINQVYTSEGLKSVRRSTPDGCFEAFDTIYVDLYDGPDRPLITDNFGINIASDFPTTDIELCFPDTIILTATDFGTDSIAWTDPVGNLISNAATISVTQQGTYTLWRTDDNGCIITNFVTIDLFYGMPNVNLLWNFEDTIFGCFGELIPVYIYDDIMNPLGDPVSFGSDTNYSDVDFEWILSPTYPFSFTLDTASNFATFEAVDSTGWYNLTVQYIRATPCDTDTFVLTDSFYVAVLPNPTLPPISLTLSGSPYFCPGESTTLTATNAPNYLWNGVGISNDTTNSVTVNQEGVLSITTTLNDTNQYGCTAQVQDNILICVKEKPQPTISASSEILCPNDVVILKAIHDRNAPPCQGAFIDSLSGFTWEGPSGILMSTNDTVSVSEAGQYFVTYNDGDSCELISNTITINQYTTPSLSVSGDPVICDGDSIILSVVTNAGSTIEWQAPLSGDSTSQVIYAPGTYVCKITSCGIETFADITIDPSGVEAVITGGDILCIDSTITLFGSPGMTSYNWWPSGQNSDTLVIADSGSFVLTTSDSNGCFATSDTFHVPITQDPTLISLAGYPVFCEGESLTLFGNNEMDNYFWLPDSQTTQNIVITDPGTYTLRTIDTNGCKGLSEQLEITNPPTFAPIIISGPTDFCEDEFVTLVSNRTRGLATFNWLPNNEDTRSITVFDAGTYVLVTIDTFGCPAVSDSVQVTVQLNQVLTPSVADTVVCAGTSLELTANTNIGDILWYLPNDTNLLSTGETYVTPPLTKSTSYYLFSNYLACNSDVTNVFIEVKDCEAISVPNIFTPNGDGQNDIWRTNLEEEKCFTCFIYNRWGILIHTHEAQTMGWDGTIDVSGEFASEGVYYYIVEYCQFDDEVIEHRGFLTLLRE